jgi:hypothetical protein
MPEPIFMKLGTHITAPQPISTAILKIPPISNINITASPISEANP